MLKEGYYGQRPMKMLEREDFTQVYEAVNPLDRRDGRVPSWFEVTAKVGLEDYPRGKKKLFQSFYRAHRALAMGKKIKGRRLINCLMKHREFQELEAEHPEKLSQIVAFVNKRLH